MFEISEKNSFCIVGLYSTRCLMKEIRGKGILYVNYSYLGSCSVS